MSYVITKLLHVVTKKKNELLSTEKNIENAKRVESENQKEKPLFYIVNNTKN